MTELRETRWGLVLAIWAAGLGVAAQYGKISVVFARMGELYPDAGHAIGFTVSLVGLLGILLGVVAGMFVAAFGFRRTLLWSLWTGALMSALQALHLPFDLFLASRVFEGLSHLGVVVAAPTLIAQVTAERHRGFALTLWSTFFSVAFALLAWLGLPLVDRWGVLALFAAHAAVMAGLAVLLGAALRGVPVPARTAMPQLRALPDLHLKIYRNPWRVAPAAGWLFYTCCFVSILTVLPPYIDEGARAFVMGAMPLTSIAVSMTLGVWLLRWMSAVHLAQTGFLLSAAAMVWLWAAPGLPAACLALAGALGLVQGSSFAAVAQLNSSAAARAEANGVLAQAGNAGNTIGTPMMVLVLSLAGFGGLALTTVLILLAGFAVHWLLAARRNGAAAEG